MFKMVLILMSSTFAVGILIHKNVMHLTIHLIMILTHVLVQQEEHIIGANHPMLQKDFVYLAIILVF